DSATLAVRRPARAAVPRPTRPAGAAGRVPGGVPPPPVPPGQGAPAAVRAAPPGARARRAGGLPAGRHLRRGAARAGRRAAVGGAAHLVRRRPLRARARLRGRPGGPGLRHDARGLLDVGQRPQAAAHGGLLPLAARPLRPAHGRRRAGRWAVEPRPRQPRAAAEAPDPGPRGAVAARRGRRRRAGARGPRPLAARRSRRLRRRGRPALGSGDAVGGHRAPAALRRAPARGLRADRGRHAGAGPVDGAQRPVARAQPRPAAPPGVRPRGRAGLPAGPGPAQQRRGLRPPGDRLARVHLVAVLALPAGLPRPQRPPGDRRAAGVVPHPRRRAAGDRQLPVVGPAGPARAGVGAPHPAADGARQLRAAARLGPAAGDRVVPRGLRRRLRLGDAAERHRDEPARRRRPHDHQALRRRRRLPRPDERLLRRLRLRPEGPRRRDGLPLHGGLLGLPRAQRRAAAGQPPDAPAADGPAAAARPRRPGGPGARAGRRAAM
ncbi:MAG: FIG01134144: hypothetical protein, partial [uncultured Frankineae bacterium]